MPGYVIEAYATPLQAEDVELALSQLAEGTSVRHVRTTYMPQDESCFHFVEAPSLRAVRDVLDRAGISYDRIVEGIELQRARSNRDMRRRNER